MKDMTEVITRAAYVPDRLKGIEHMMKRNKGVVVKGGRERGKELNGEDGINHTKNSNRND